MKLIIEVDQETLYECKMLFVKGISNNAEYAVANGTPIAEGDMISREALKAELEAYRHTRNYKSDEEEAQNSLLDNILEDIDNAPSIGGKQND